MRRDNGLFALHHFKEQPGFSVRIAIVFFDPGINGFSVVMNKVRPHIDRAVVLAGVFPGAAAGKGEPVLFEYSSYLRMAVRVGDVSA